MGVGLARDAGDSVQLLNRGDAIAGKPAPTQASSHIKQNSVLFENNNRCSHARNPNWHQPDLLEQRRPAGPGR
ncbi:hypothetical protein F7R12_17680 [Pseudomonas tolaasii]|nr:hypothetical protein F7R12_17680 [Pseudomonas tolaasii]